MSIQKAKQKQEEVKLSSSLIVCFSSQWGLREQLILEDALYLNRKGHDTWIMGVSGSLLLGHCQKNGIPWIAISPKKFGFIKKWVKKKSINLVHAVGYRALTQCLLALWADRKTSLVASLYGTVPFQIGKFLGNLVSRRLDAILVPDLKFVSNLQWALQTPLKKFRVIPVAPVGGWFGASFIEWKPIPALLHEYKPWQESKKKFAVFYEDLDLDQLKLWLHGFGRFAQFQDEGCHIFFVKVLREEKSENHVARDLEGGRIYEESLQKTYGVSQKISFWEASHSCIKTLILKFDGVVLPEYPRKVCLDPLYLWENQIPFALSRSSLSQAIFEPHEKAWILRKADAFSLSGDLQKWASEALQEPKTYRVKRGGKVEPWDSPDKRHEILLREYHRSLRRRRGFRRSFMPF